MNAILELSSSFSNLSLENSERNKYLHKAIDQNQPAEEIAKLLDIECSNDKIEGKTADFTAFYIAAGTGKVDLAKKLLALEPSRDCRRPKTLRQYPYEKQTIPNRS